MDSLSILSICKEVVLTNKFITFILILFSLFFVLSDKFLIQKFLLLIVNNMKNTEKVKYFLGLTGLVIITSGIVQTYIDYKTNFVGDTITNILLQRMTNIIHKNHEKDIHGLQPQLLTTYFEKLNSSLLDIVYSSKWRKITIIILPIFIIMYASYNSPKLALIIIISVVLIVLIAYKLLLSTSRLGKEYETNKNKFLELFHDFVYNLVSIYSHDTGKNEIKMLIDDSLLLQNRSIKYYFDVNYKKAIVVLSSIIILLCILYQVITGFQSISYKIKENLVILWIALLLELYGFFGILVPMIEKIHIYHTISNNFKMMSDKIIEPRHTVNLINDFNIIINNLEYKTILNGINLEIPFGQRVAILGSIGCGKSTLLKLILRYIHPKDGEVLLGNNNINDINIRKFRSVISYIPQHVYLFNRTIEENLFYGSILSEHEKTEIVDRLNVRNFFGNDLKRKVGNNGAVLSGGQRQLLYILRNIIQPSRKIIILDEPTVGLDPNCKKYLLELLNQIHDKTILIVTHDDDILKIVDRVLFMEGGKISGDKTI
jgi:ABC-type multidrug transport system fused ATPase/permease subunit